MKKISFSWMSIFCSYFIPLLITIELVSVLLKPSFLIIKEILSVYVFVPKPMLNLEGNQLGMGWFSAELWQPECLFVPNLFKYCVFFKRKSIYNWSEVAKSVAWFNMLALAVTDWAFFPAYLRARIKKWILKIYRTKAGSLFRFRWCCISINMESSLKISMKASLSNKTIYGSTSTSASEELLGEGTPPFVRAHKGAG